MTYASKNTKYGWVEVRDASTKGWYALIVDGRIVAQSADYYHIMSEYNKY